MIIELMYCVVAIVMLQVWGKVDSNSKEKKIQELEKEKEILDLNKKIQELEKEKEDYKIAVMDLLAESENSDIAKELNLIELLKK